ncbi:MAG: GIY-YIG nuclease family protein [Microcoleus sp. PH2017_10_PVI_O_A]|uniref:GIY-YIG nuclease family protein n=1 Tax=unclassified Microcoleus TaxID=2642155 RepID=UPI001D3EBEC8|nr:MULTISPECIES: GIY-YIG nuclease family protein [unclassified Microcoleus]TAE76769.1 MAG: GIY-YIG nuclease family protein [Oscillatoriales cyanobacterium]MCC3409195.1 GIY-YIG nuclease family protein [Microcoleus sp. PH2017_10_PVI_O_A]MCC3463432.1 GIY-YIG nuclease family protein [Microcoleus sp. PH2017_11_PCY_U_A]MCC3481799.1 GIY-YIG nuclease family protein [Microcoleus sp. PH2017_12_PCY_D_A]MCC3530814.1 GIY-YIG nuclease family protein [Microcoleus sp. PH2017_21_RUC_O_A]
MPPKYTTDEDLELLAELGVDIAPEASGQRSAREERIIAGFEEIERFVNEQGRLPQHGDDRDIFERLYAVRLDRLRESEECRAVLEPLDSRGLLNAENDASLTLEADDEALLASLGVDAASENDVTQLVNVRSRSEIKAAEEIAQRTPCQDFDEFKPIFNQVQRDLDTGARKTIKYQDYAAVKEGDLFILDGQKVMVVDMGESFVSDYGRSDCRLRVVYDNATESDLLLRSLQRALNKDKASRRITNLDFGPLFSGIQAEDDLPTGCIYVLRSRSDHPFIAENRSVIHKIGVTGGDVKSRIANAKKDPTYLLADVEIVTTFKLANINRKGLEKLIHKFFSSARLELALPDRFGSQVQPQEWFLVPVEAIEEAIEKINEGTIEQFRYDRETVSLVRS